VGVSAAPLKRVALVLFALPLGLLVGVAASLQSAGFAQQPLTSLVVIIGVVGAYMALISSQGTRLLNSLQLRYL